MDSAVEYILDTTE